MASRILKFTAGTSLNLQPIAPTERCSITGWAIYNTAAAARFVKLYWGAPGSFSGGGTTPTVGTDIPAITIGLATASFVANNFSASGLTGTGVCFVATTVNAADSDSTAVTSGDLIVSLFWE
jgi:hypothetical protein